MKLEPKHWAVIAALITGTATQLLSAQHGWSDIATPGFVAGLLIQVSAAITAIFVGAPGATAALEQANKNTEMANESTRAALADPVDLGKVDPKRFIPPVALLVCLLVLPSCAANRIPSTITTPAGQSAYRADQVIDRLNEVSDLVIGDTGEFPGGIKPADAFTIIEWISGDAHGHPPTTGVAQLVANTAGQGWKATAKASYQARIRTLLLNYPSLSAYVPIIDALLEVL